MSATLRDVRGGEPLARVLTADRINAWNRAARRAEGFNFERQGRYDSATKIDVRSGLSFGLPQFAVGVLGEPAVLPSANLNEFCQRPCVNFVAPTGPADKAPVAILYDPLAAPSDGYASIGRATILGLTPVQIHFDTGQGGYEWADVQSGNTVYMLAKQYSGPARIVWKESGTGLLWAYVILMIQLATAECP